MRPRARAEAVDGADDEVVVTHAEGDAIGASAPRTFAALTVADKQLITFTAAEGADDHCEAAARTLFDARAFAWLDDRLHPEVTA